MRVYGRRKQSLRESSEKHVLELIYNAYYSLHCPEFPDEDYIETIDTVLYYLFSKS